MTRWLVIMKTIIHSLNCLMLGEFHQIYLIHSLLLHKYYGIIIHVDPKILAPETSYTVSRMTADLSLLTVVHTYKEYP